MSFRLTKLGIVCVVTFVSCFIILVVGISTKTRDCDPTGPERRSSLVWTAVFIMLATPLGILGSSKRWGCLIWSYHFFLLVTSLVGLILFGIMMSRSYKGSGESLPGKGYKEYRLQAYPRWLREFVNDTKAWKRTKTCLVDSKICTDFNTKYKDDDTAEKFYKRSFSALKSGCCKPSNDCGFTYQSPTNWTEENGVFNNPDCNAWDNDPNVLCYNCQSCKAAMVDAMKRPIKKFFTFTFVLYFVLLILFFAGIFAHTADKKHYESTS